MLQAHENQPCRGVTIHAFRDELHPVPSTQNPLCAKSWEYKSDTVVAVHSPKPCDAELTLNSSGQSSRAEKEGPWDVPPQIQKRCVWAICGSAASQQLSLSQISGRPQACILSSTNPTRARGQAQPLLSDRRQPAAHFKNSTAAWLNFCSFQGLNLIPHVFYISFNPYNSAIQKKR